MHAIRMIKEGMNLKESRKGYVGGLGERKKKEVL